MACHLVVWVARHRQVINFYVAVCRMSKVDYHLAAEGQGVLEDHIPYGLRWCEALTMDVGRSLYVAAVAAVFVADQGMIHAINDYL